MPEICKKSLVSCPANGGLELFIIGKNFLKDTRVIFQARRLLPPTSDSFSTIWEEAVVPDKEFLQQVGEIFDIDFHSFSLINFVLFRYYYRRGCSSLILFFLVFCLFCQTHLICTVPSYIDVDIIEPVTVQMLVTSSNKYSEPHTFIYTPKTSFGQNALMPATTLSAMQQTVVQNVQGIL